MLGRNAVFVTKKFYGIYLSANNNAVSLDDVIYNAVYSLSCEVSHPDDFLISQQRYEFFLTFPIFYPIHCDNFMFLCYYRTFATSKQTNNIINHIN